MSTVEERRRPDLFEGRLKLNAMALPSHTTFVRMVEGDETSWSEKDAFEAEIDFADRAALLDLVNLAARTPGLRRKDIGARYQVEAESRFAETYRLARVLRRGARKFSFENEEIRVRARVKRDVVNDIDSAFFAATPNSTALSRLMLEGGSRWYTMQDGVTVPSNGPAGAAFLNKYPTSSGDPDKVMRAAAFAGWVLAPIHSGKSLEEIADLVQRYTRLK
ncbi:hypothetical protein [Novosphingobium aerophilum]|uniref:Uncharacterized protein n=1 Tax=Novosphingobium aerophilum TaxID=2839843 RepID=A0A7X1FBQ1_9SPHN|nr:hypothetical protein [Novosphingobium aerophilum]MBC2653609.1 hypothetical protein [Novosphingobium aerophilum]